MVQMLRNILSVLSPDIVLEIEMYQTNEILDTGYQVAIVDWGKLISAGKQLFHHQFFLLV